jgi:hypothetical protein
LGRFSTVETVENGRKNPVKRVANILIKGMTTGRGIVYAMKGDVERMFWWGNRKLLSGFDITSYSPV